MIKQYQRRVITEIAATVGVVLLVIACFAAFVWIVQWAWNTLVPSVFHGPSIDFVQAIAVAVFLTCISGGTRYVRSSR